MIDKVAAVVSLAVMLVCFWLLLNHGIPLQMEQDALKNAKHWEARK
jgi:hypothetical protein